MTAETSIGPMFVGEHSSQVHAVEIADEAVLLHEPSGELHLLNLTGALVWRCLDGQSTVEAIGRDIAAVADVPLATVMADMQTLLADLVDGRLVVQA